VNFFYWDQRLLGDHYRDHPCDEPCWTERFGHSISIEEYEEQSYRTAERAKIIFLSRKRKYDENKKSGYDTRLVRQFVDGMIFTTIVDNKSNRVKTHFHIHKPGAGSAKKRKNGVHEPGSTKRDFQLLLDEFLEYIERKERNEFSKLKIDKVADSVGPSIASALRLLEK
jgi:hypothetical protein